MIVPRHDFGLVQSCLIYIKYIIMISLESYSFCLEIWIVIKEVDLGNILFI